MAWSLPPIIDQGTLDQNRGLSPIVCYCLVVRGVHLGAVPALALGVRGDGADLLDGFAELAVVELLAGGGVIHLDEAADLVRAVAPAK